MPRAPAVLPFAIAALCAAAGGAATAATTLPNLAELAAGTTPHAPRLAGLAVATATPRAVHAAAWGAAELAPDGTVRTRLQPTSPARVASVSKLVTALVALRLAESGRIDLDRDVAAYGLPLRNPLSPGAPVTLRMLLGHRSGLSDADFITVPLGRPALDAIDPARPDPARWTSPPGLRFAYANVNYGLAATVLEAATATRFDRLAHNLVLAPLRLDAGFNWSGMSATAAARGATLYRLEPTGWTAQADAPGNRPANACPAILATPTSPCALAAYVPGANGFRFSPQGGLRASAADLAVIGAALLHSRRPATPPSRAALLTAPALAALFTATPPAAGLPPTETYNGLMRAWGAGAQCLTGHSSDSPAPATRGWCGHLGDAYGLTAGLWIDRASGRAHAYIVTGAAALPEAWPGRSRFTRWEEFILQNLAATAGRSDLHTPNPPPLPTPENRGKTP